MSLIDPYQIATCGQNSQNTFTLASNGILVDVFIDDLPPVILPPDFGSGGGIIPGQEWPPKEEDKICRKKITVVATIKGKKYTETLIVEDMPNLSVNNVGVNVLPNDDKPIITISIKK